MNEKVTVTVNGKKATFFLGMKVRHGLGWPATKAVQQGQAEVRDGDGNVVGLDGALYDGEVIVVRYLKKGS